MGQLVILNLGKGDWLHGFPMVTAQLWDADRRTSVQISGSLPPAPELSTIYQQWHRLYEVLHQRISWRHSRSAIEIDEDDIVDVSDAEFRALCQQLKSGINRWLDAQSFGKIERQLRTKLVLAVETQIVVETDNEDLRRLPWHLWNLFEDYPHAEMALSAQEYERVDAWIHQGSGKVRVLAILGNSQIKDARTQVDT